MTSLVPEKIHEICSVVEIIRTCIFVVYLLIPDLLFDKTKVRRIKDVFFLECTECIYDSKAVVLFHPKFNFSEYI